MIKEISPHKWNVIQRQVGAEPTVISHLLKERSSILSNNTSVKDRNFTGRTACNKPLITEQLKDRKIGMCEGNE